jgi:hypothetical protein
MWQRLKVHYQDQGLLPLEDKVNDVNYDLSVDETLVVLANEEVKELNVQDKLHDVVGF